MVRLEEREGRRMPHWTRQYCLRRPRPFAVSHPERYVLACYARSNVDRAYRLAVAAERFAVRHGNQPLAIRLHAFVVSVGTMRRYSKTSVIVGLEQSAQQSAAREHWAQAVAYTEQILKRHPQNSGIRLRALANRASGLHNLGRMADAILAYDALKEDAEAWSGLAANYRAAFSLSREVACWHLGWPIDLTGVRDATIQLGKAPVTWMAYWWLLGHVAWRQTPARLGGLRQSSIRTFELDWNLEYDRILWGLDLLVAALNGDTEVAEKRVRYALTDPPTVVFIGRSGWFDLYSDWLLFLMTYRPDEAIAESRRLIGWCTEYGYDGWAQHWRQRILDPVMPAF